MLVDPDGHWVWLAVNAGFAVYDGYKAYKAGKGWKGVAWAAASNFGPGKVFKGAKKALGFAKGAHRNSKKSKAKNHLYEIYDRGSGKIVKSGISFGRISKSGHSYRATRQANKWGKGRYGSRIVKKNINGRARALLYEQAHVNKLSRQGRLDLSAGRH
jgi:hypothetical protein